jgi:hypothetical protein
VGQRSGVPQSMFAVDQPDFNPCVATTPQATSLAA